MINPKTILVVDDDSMIRGGLRTVLRENGYLTLEADDGLEAKDLIHAHRPDLVILDMMMPRWGGFAVLEHFHNNPVAPPFIMLTAHDGAKHKAYAKQIGVADYLLKPFSLERLLHKIDRLVNPGEKTKTPGDSLAMRGGWPACSTRGARALLVEIHKPLLRAVKQGLEDEGFSVDTAEAGEEADLKARAGGYDVIVLDLICPNVAGLTLLANWRTAGITTEVLVLTAKDTTEEKVKGLEFGADACMTRPFMLPELLARLRALVRRHRQINDPVVRVHDLEIDAATRTVRRGGQPIHLTPREFSLLQLLAQHRGNVVTRAMIWEHLYEGMGAITSNVVEVFVRYLRTKLDNPFKKKLILTRWGEGYSLRGEDK
jgi:DNA-binding response OmpR family regulator